MAEETQARRQEDAEPRRGLFEDDENFIRRIFKEERNSLIVKVVAAFLVFSLLQGGALVWSVSRYASQIEANTAARVAGQAIQTGPQAPNMLDQRIQTLSEAVATTNKALEGTNGLLLKIAADVAELKVDVAVLAERIKKAKAQ